MSPAERILIEEAAKARVIAAAVGDWILGQETPIAVDGELLPVVVQHAGIVANLTKLLTTLGLKRVAKPVSLASTLAGSET